MRLPDLDGSRVRAAVDLAEEIYRLHEAGRPYAFELSQLSEATSQQLELADADGAFGSVAAADWAHDLLALSAGIPEDLTRAHLVEMVEAAQATVLPEWQVELGHPMRRARDSLCGLHFHLRLVPQNVERRDGRRRLRRSASGLGHSAPRAVRVQP